VRLLLLGTRVFRAAVVLLIVAFNLVVLAVRNPLDLWKDEVTACLYERPRCGHAAAAQHPAEEERGREREGLATRDRPTPHHTPSYLDDVHVKERYEKADALTKRYVRMAGFEQDWCMFSPGRSGMSRDVYFLAVRLEFADNSSELIFSQNEPQDPSHYLRIGGWQIRKLENYVMKPTSRELEDPKDSRFYGGYARHVAERWRQDHPSDPRELRSIYFVRRWVFFPAPGQCHKDVDEPISTDVAVFDAQGRNGRALR
jgi:hypothetical protein